MGIWWFVSILFRAAFQPTHLLHSCRPLDDLLGRLFFSCCRISSAPRDSCLFSASADNLLPALSRLAYRALGPSTNPSRPAPLTQPTPSHPLPGSASRTLLPSDLPSHPLPGSASRTLLPSDLPSHPLPGSASRTLLPSDLPSHSLPGSASRTLLPSDLPSHSLPGSASRTLLPPDLPSHSLPGSASRTLLPSDLPSHPLPGSASRTLLPPDLPSHPLSGSASRTPLPPNLPCDTCALPASQFCLSCDHPVCSRHLYPCSDCQLAFCGNCFDLHNLEGHWSDSDTALALARTLRLGSQSFGQQTDLRPSPGPAPLAAGPPPPRAFFSRRLLSRLTNLAAGSAPPRAFFSRRLLSRRTNLAAGSPPPRAFFRRLLPPLRAPLGDVFFPQPLRALPLETTQ
jgi:hypothetical protein